ncbi:VOC family protein [Lactobacillus terrae]|uniref:VOC family protein n=1 Tax=Lactobacillus terrae TaxID=2269374 RepID=UPI000C1B7607|nr:VOC family protein [Lactobacillus terrae]
MKIDHVAIWTSDLEKMKNFYQKYFDVEISDLYVNNKTTFKSYFIKFESGSRIELTTKRFLFDNAMDTIGYSHIAIAVGDQSGVEEYVERFMADGYPIVSGPRITGDGYYEAVIQDPEGNLIELTTD